MRFTDKIEQNLCKLLSLPSTTYPENMSWSSDPNKGDLRTPLKGGYKDSNTSVTDPKNDAIVVV